MQNLQLTKPSLHKFNGYEKNQLNEKCLGYLFLTKLYDKNSFSLILMKVATS